MTSNFHTLLAQTNNPLIGTAIEDPFKLCFELAIKALGKVSPNPLVGAVLLDEKNILIGYGFHEYLGGNHAEVNAVQMAKSTRTNLSACKLFVNLQPCTHVGRTPACAAMIKSEGIKEVYYLYDDPNPIVEKNQDFIRQKSMQAFKYQDLIAPFLFAVKNNQRPFVAVKTAVSKNGFIAEQGDSRRWVTNGACRAYGHVLRHYYDAVLVGRKTVAQDQPSLLPRLSFMDDKIPWRVILDKELKTLSLQIELDEKVREKTIFVHASKEKLNFHTMKSLYLNEADFGVHKILKALRQEFEIQSILIEGGATTHASFFEAEVVDRVYKFSGDEDIDAAKGIAWYQSQKPFQFELCKELDLDGHRLDEYIRPGLLTII